jgi:hypothetical protein
MRKDIEDLIKSLKLPKFGFKGQYECAEEYLSPDEEVLFIYPGNANISTTSEKDKFKANHLDLKNKNPGIFVITPRRVFHANRYLGGHIEQIYKEEIASYRLSKIGVIQIFSNHRSIEVDIQSRKVVVEAAKSAMLKILEDNGPIIKEKNEVIGESKSIDIPEQIKKLADLRDVGILSEQEFTQKKKELLERF